MVTTPVTTRYLKGFEVPLGFDPEVWKLAPYARDTWGKKYLQEQGVRPLSVTYMIPVYKGNTNPVEMRIVSVEFTADALKQTPQ